MTEVDTVMPEASSQPSSMPDTPATVHMSSTNVAPPAVVSTTASATSNSQQLKDQQNGINSKVNLTKKNNVADSHGDSMDVDGADTEEDDSQITSSTENGAAGIGVGGDDSKMSSDEDNAIITNKNTPTLSTDDSKCTQDADVSAAPAKSVQAGTILENSSSSCDGVSHSSFQAKSLANENSQDNTQSIEKSDQVDDTKGSNTNDAKQNQQPSSTVDKGLTDVDSSSQGDKSLNCRDLNSSVAAISAEPMETSGDPLSTNSLGEAHSLQKENGIANNAAELQNNASGFVDLGDDSDDDDEERETVPKPNQRQDPDSTSTDNGVKPSQDCNAGAVKKSQSICSDSDGAVVIASDSDTETSPKRGPVLKTALTPKVNETQIIDDDDDDCVVIEDDTPAPSANDLSKRKSMAMDSPSHHSDDSQPPSKRQRNAPQPNMNQITIKDARSLLPQDAATVAAVAAAKKVAEGNVYPVNITQATSINPGPPKLVPMINPNNMAMSAFPGLNSNTNLLPGLTDDMFVLEAPSFIVPYIYEKPPVDNLREIVRDIEAQYKLSKEDLAEADKPDEFDMMTEQNKEEKDDKSSKKKKRRRGGNDPDESWSEESDEDDDDDDDDDSEAGLRTKVLIKEAVDDLTVLKSAIKPAAVLAQSPTSAAAAAAKPGQENYFESPLGKFFMDIGVGLVQEFVQSDLIRLQKRKMRKSLGKNITEFERAITALSGNLDASKKKNSPFKFTMKRCEFCNFKSESALAMANHYETPHMNGALYKCNFCSFEIRNATEIVYHMEAIHNIKARLIKPLPYHQCPNCGFEDNGKAKLSRHQPVCAKKFRPELNLTPPNDWEAPAKIPRIKPRHGLVGTATAYQAMAAQAAAQKAALASIQQQQQQAAQARSMQAAALAAQNAVNKIRGRPPVITKPGPVPGPLIRGPVPLRNPMATNVVLPNNYQMAGGQLLQAANAMAKKTLSGQPSISITPLPRQNTAPTAMAPSTSKMPPAGMKPGQSPGGNSKAQFVICEICDGYIKDLEQLRNHMQWMHKVKIHPKMIYNRPPLNCQKCQFRFFTDQGLERHLLGSHGLVTSSMQEAANKGKDAGRCPVCGRMYQWKLLNHVSRDHHMTLKPAHLSYKCTVCTATFGMYKQFETHVYTAHSTVAKKAMDGKKNNSATGPGAGMGGSSNIGMNHQQRSNLLTTNDSLLKPLKINDEITIIPQPASKSRITNMESHIID